MASLPPGFRPPGQKPTEDTKRYQRQAHAFGGVQQGLYELEQQRKAKKGFVVEPVWPTDKHSTIRTADGRLRNEHSRKFVKDFLPNHKRMPPISPWNKGKKYKRKVKT